jgi:hypothetical protein
MKNLHVSWNTNKKRGRPKLIKKRNYVKKTFKKQIKDDREILSVAGLNNNLQRVRLHRRKRKDNISHKVNDLEINKLDSNLNNSIIHTKRNSELMKSKIYNINFFCKFSFLAIIENVKIKISFNNFKRYIIDQLTYYDLTETLNFLKIYFNIDYENFILKDEQKQEFKAKVNDFLRDYTLIYKKTQILILKAFIREFFEMISRFVGVNIERILNKFWEMESKMKEEKLECIIDYIQPSAFVCETPIRNEDAYKKKTGQYVKYKTIPKWHHYAWDMIK